MELTCEREGRRRIAGQLHGPQDIALVRQRVLQAAALATDVRTLAVGDRFGRDFGKAAHIADNGETH